MRVMLSWLHDWSKILRAVYNPGIKKHEPVHILGCSSCGRASGDLREDEHAWDGWTYAPLAVCPDCNETVWTGLNPGQEYPSIEERRSAYLKQLESVKNNGGKHE